MKFVKVDVTEIKEKGVKNTDVFKVLNDFQKSGFECVRLQDYKHKDAKSCAESFRSAIRRYKLKHIKVMARGDDVYLVNTIYSK